MFGVDGSAAIINHPEVAILGIGRIIERPWVVDGQIVARQMTQLTLAFDHRVCDGGTAGGFLRFVADCVESPAQAIRNMRVIRRSPAHSWSPADKEPAAYARDDRPHPSACCGPTLADLVVKLGLEGSEAV